QHIIVCGHYGCGGVKAAMTHHNMGIINKWLRNIKDVYRFHRELVDAVTDEEAKTDLMVELNVREQVMNLAKTSIIQKAWKSDNRPNLHGWVYGLKDGIIKPVCEMPARTPLDDIYEYDDL
ncbi:MAG TPA: carbonic anhydrase, partial [Bacteroidia bacterium]|nr:carbonic anhydrase [Bacteroidia bacterium]